MLTNFSRHTLDPQSTEYKFVAEKFNHSLEQLKKHPTMRTPVPRLAPATPPVQVPHLPPLPPPSGSVSTQSFLSRHMPPQSFPFGPLTTQPFSLGPPSAPPITPGPPPSVQAFVSMMNNPVSSGFQQITPHQVGPIQTSTNNNVPSSTSVQTLSNPTVGNLPIPSTLPSHPTASSLAHPSNSLSHAASQIHRRRRYISQSHTGHHAALPANNTVFSFQPPPTNTPAMSLPKIIQIERIQNQRWYKQYAAHECEFRLKLGKSTEQWLFHGIYK